jgi:hypothetical protein
MLLDSEKAALNLFILGKYSAVDLYSVEVSSSRRSEYFPKSTFHKWDVSGIKTFKIMPISNAKIVRCPSCDYYQKGDVIEKVYKMMI